HRRLQVRQDRPSTQGPPEGARRCPAGLSDSGLRSLSRLRDPALLLARRGNVGIQAHLGGDRDLSVGLPPPGRSPLLLDRTLSLPGGSGVLWSLPLQQDAQVPQAAEALAQG